MELNEIQKLKKFCFVSVLFLRKTVFAAATGMQFSISGYREYKWPTGQPQLLPCEIHHNRWAEATVPTGLSQPMSEHTARIIKCEAKGALAWGQNKPAKFFWKCTSAQDTSLNPPSFSPPPGIRSAGSGTSPHLPQPSPGPLKGLPPVPCILNLLLLRRPRLTQPCSTKQVSARIQFSSCMIHKYYKCNFIFNRTLSLFLPVL